MLEALVAVGLAGNVVQFVQFASSLVLEAEEIRKKGRPSSLPALIKLTEALQKQAKVITTRLKASNETLQYEDQNLLDIAADCENAGIDFLAYLNSVGPQTTSSNPLRHAQASIRFRWAHDKIEDFVHKLDRFRNSLTLATVLALRSSSAGVHEEVLGHLKGLQDGGQTLLADNSSILSTLQCLVDLVQDQSGPRLDELQGQILYCVKQISGLRFVAGMSRENEFLQGLNFRQKDLRYEEIDPAYRATFEWIFREPGQEPTWDDLTAYLTKDDFASVYFVDGKAGSGKSTLMNFIARHPRTVDAVRSWAGTGEYMILTFFFWNVGTPLQKSHVGLLRALLHGVLRRYPELIPAVFPVLYLGWQTAEDDQEPYYVELKAAFELLVQNRPINACINAFKGCPTARLQDLTRNDMSIFIQGELSSHPLMVQRLGFRTTSSSARKLVKDIEEKAEGVFLWVKLVVKILLDGLEAGDDIEDLQHKLNTIPSDLKDLYRAMFCQRPHEYRVQANEMFRIFSEWNETTNGSPLSAIAFSHAVRPYDEVFDSTVTLLEYEYFDMAVQNIAARIRSRCCGLLEVRRKNHRPVVDSRGMFYGEMGFLEGSRVAYLHKTVAEFIASDDVWKDISLHNYLNIMVRACRRDSMSDRLVRRYIEEADRTMNIHWAKPDTAKTSNDPVSDHHWSKRPYDVAQRDERVSKQLRQIASIQTFAARHGLLRYLNGTSFHRFDSDHRCAMVLHAQDSWLDHTRYSSAHDSANADLDGPIGGVGQGRKVLVPSLEDRSATLAYLLEHAASPETIIELRTVWSYALYLLTDLLEGKGNQNIIEIAELLRVYLCSAADSWNLIHDPHLRSPHRTIKLVEIVNSIIELLRHDSKNEALTTELEHLCFRSASTPRKRRRSENSEYDSHPSDIVPTDPNNRSSNGVSQASFPWVVQTTFNMPYPTLMSNFGNLTTRYQSLTDTSIDNLTTSPSLSFGNDRRLTNGPPVSHQRNQRSPTQTQAAPHSSASQSKRAGTRHKRSNHSNFHRGRGSRDCRGRRGWRAY
ncbi:hypothetical protein BDV96DRAFT_599443 [Lophiotrema nucula]|uniref:NACHT domain-containing protein n=1 Tax=Lophiotrema nucula TaxID=690887 RepID=A0A6A5ZB17_9PLEO|nr:hypothetical protein BDV96DRAFT_599443 [Lophiotrema nucula]